MTEDQYTERLNNAALAIATAWTVPSTEPPAIIEWFVGEFAAVFIRQAEPIDCRIAIAEAWSSLRERLRSAVLEVVRQRGEEGWAQFSSDSRMYALSVDRELKRVTIEPHVAELNKAVAVRIETLALVIDFGAPGVEQLIETASRELSVRMLLAGQGINAEAALSGAERIAREVLVREAEKLVAARAGE